MSKRTGSSKSVLHLKERSLEIHGALVLSAEIGSREREVKKERTDTKIACRTDHSSTLEY